jgi:hypothetical protein
MLREDSFNIHPLKPTLPYWTVVHLDYKTETCPRNLPIYVLNILEGARPDIVTFREPQYLGIVVPSGQDIPIIFGHGPQRYLSSVQRDVVFPQSHFSSLIWTSQKPLLF